MSKSHESITKAGHIRKILFLINFDRELIPFDKELIICTHNLLINLLKEKKNNLQHIICHFFKTT